MSPAEAAILRRKLHRITVSLDQIRLISRMTLEDYTSPERILERNAAERLLQKAIEAALDINAHLVAELGGELPADYYGGFLAVGQLGVISNELAAQLAPSAGLRNRLVHEYEEIDDTKVFDSIGSILRLYPAYVGAVEGYLEQQGL